MNPITGAPQMRIPNLLLLIVITLAGTTVQALAPQDLRVGHWVELRGAYQDGTFVAERMDLRDPSRHLELRGVIRLREDGTPTLHGKRLLGPRMAKLRNGKRARVSGLPHGGDGLYVTRVRTWDGDEARIRGRIDRVNTAPDGSLHVTLAGIDALLPPTAQRRQRVPLEEARRTLPVPSHSSDQALYDSDDTFGKGLMIGGSLHAALQQDLTYNGHFNYELDRRDDRDVDADDNRDDLNHNLRAQLTWSPNSRLTGVLDVQHRLRRREIRHEEVQHRADARLRSAFLLWRDLPGGFDVALGRQDFDDPREWLYDHDLDAVRLFRRGKRLNWELSASTSVDGDSERNEQAVNTMLYVSAANAETHKAAYVINRRFDDDAADRQTHLGLRWLAPAGEGLGGWIDTSYMFGDLDNRRARGWAVDGGASWTPSNSNTTVTLGYAFASGSSDGDDTFRQSGLQDNNGRLGGNQSVRYYGEVLDPELSNLHIATLSVARRFARRSSVEIIGHRYRQHALSRSLPNADLDRRPNGRDDDLGWEVDVVLALREFDRWEVNLTAGYFHPGKAFGDAEPATLAELQLRLRY